MCVTRSVRSVCVTRSVRSVCPSAEAVLQQLVGPGGTSPRHQPHGGLMKEHLETHTHFLKGGGGVGGLETKQVNKKIIHFFMR